MIDALISKIKKFDPDIDGNRVREAYEYASAAHKTQLRKDGSPYITHPTAVAEIVAEMGLDTDSVLAALLHDTIEDTGVTFDEVKSKFGIDVAELVDGVTKLEKVAYVSKEDLQMENLRKMFIAMAKDIRVIIIKIADRLHNMRTIEFQSDAKRREKALETMQIYAPIAHRLGMQKIKWELEDIALKCLDPIAYEEITVALEKNNAEQQGFLDQISQKIKAKIIENGITPHIEKRVKHVYSIYRKMYSQNKELDEIYDLYAIRVIVDQPADCYNVLGLIHEIYKPVPGRFKDYISTPKPNMYQSLHTTVIGREGVPFEVQIRTWEMHKTAEVGIAAHWKYKEQLKGKVGTEEKFEWVKRLLEAQKDSDAEDFIHSLKIDMFADEVFVFTPRGDIINLPASATPIDFAYAIHTAIGNKMTVAKVNGKIVPFDYNLQNGEICEIITSASGKGPSRDWMNIAKTSEAKNKIKQWFKKEKREENIVEGKQSFESILKQNKISLADVLENKELSQKILDKSGFKSYDELFAAIGYGGITSTRIFNKVQDELQKAKQINSDKGVITIKESKKRFVSDSGVLVEGIDNCLIKFSKCCAPIPGDEIVGFITKGYGVSIHKADCANAIRSMNKEEEKSRWIPVRWDMESRESFTTYLQITALDREGLLLDIASALAALKVNLRSINARSLEDGYAVITMSCEVRNIEQLGEIQKRIMRIKGISEISRHADNI